ncbi:MAG: 6-carboxytetrahydropterin synthase [Bdellovibrionaceae bacterium]|nr:6-carboxytetrahydropterin synthase [Pseudobdellovibrionaceae bacterium]
MNSQSSSPSATFVRRVHFSCGHRYENPAWSESKNRETFGACYSPHGHGHNYVLEAHFTGPIDSASGMVINLVDADRLLAQISLELDHRFLNQDVEYFKNHIPTTENIALYVYQRLKSLVADPALIQRVRLFECDDIWAEVGASGGLL